MGPAIGFRGLPGLAVVRDGDAVLARTASGRSRRVLLAGHLDTVPIAGNLPSRIDGDRLYGCGASDMKSGLAVLLRVAAALAEPDFQPAFDLTFVCYDNEEVHADRNGLGRIARTRPEWLNADLAILLEPTSGAVEGGCQGTLRFVVRTTGRRAHSARAWLGDNAVHAAGAVLSRLANYRPRSVDIDGCVYREGLNAVRIAGGVAGNVVPDECRVEVNFRFAPDRSVDGAIAHVRDVLAGYPLEIVDSAPGALPRLAEPAVAAVVAAVGKPAVAKYGWTDVSRFAALGIPAVNFGPGDPNLAHTRDEYALLSLIGDGERALREYLGERPPHPHTQGSAGR